MIKYYFVFALAVCSNTLLAQAEPDWMSKEKATDVSDAKPEVEAMPPSPLDEIMERMEAAIAKADDAADAALGAANVANLAAGEATKAAEDAKPSFKFDFDTPARLDALEKAVEALQSRKEWTEGEIRQLAKDEAEKLMKATVKTPSGEIKEVGAASMQVTVNGYAGTFEVKPGEKIIAINGQPIVQRAVVNQSYAMPNSPQPVVMQSIMAATPTVQLQSVPQRQGVVRFWSMPRRASTCSGPNCPQ